MKDAIKVILYQGITFGLQIAFMLLAARVLGPELQGRYAILRTCTYLIETFMWLGLTSGVTYFVAKDFARYHNALVLSSSVYVLLGIIASIPVIVFVLPRFQIPVAVGLLVVVWVVSLALTQFSLKIFLGQRRYRLFNYISILTSCGLFVCFLGFWAAGRITLQTVIYCNILSNFFGLGVSIFAHRHHLLLLEMPTNSFRALLAEFYSVGLKGYISSVAFQLLYRADFFFVGYFLGAKTLGLYSLAVFVIEAIQKVPDWLGLVLAPKVSAGLDFDGSLTRHFALGSFAFVLAISGLVGLARLAHYNYLAATLGSKFQGVEMIVLALIPRALIHSILAIYGGNLAGRGYTNYHPLAGFVGLTVLVICDSILFHYFGLISAMVGITVAYAVATSILVIGARRYAGSTTPVLAAVGA